MPPFLSTLRNFADDINPFHASTFRSPHKGKFTIHLKPAGKTNESSDDPRIAISYFLPYSDKAYTQAMDGDLPYRFVLSRVSKGGADRQKRHWWSR